MSKTRKQYLVTSGVAFKFVICICFILFAYNYLNSNKFFIDANTIYKSFIGINNDELFKFIPFDGFSNTAKIYKIILLGHVVNFDTLFILSSIIYILTFIFLIKNVKVKTNYNKFIFFCFIFIFDAIFLMQPSKDSFGLLFNVLVFKSIIKDKRISNLYITILMSIYAVMFRQYYFLILAIYFYAKIVSQFKKVGKALLIVFAGVLIYYLFYKTSYLNKMIDIRYWNEFTLGGNTNTLMQNIIPYGLGEKNIVKYFENYMINLARILSPIEVLWKSPSRGIFFVPIQLFLDYLLFKYIKITRYEFKENRKIKNILIYIFSFILVQAVFEPDFGSVFRHSMNLMPFYLYLYFSLDYKKIVKGIKEGNIIKSSKKLSHRKLRMEI